MCQSTVLLVRLPVNSRLLVVKFWGSQKLYLDFQVHGGISTSNPHIVQWSTVLENSINQINQNITVRTSLVAQWLRICLPMQGTRVRALVREDPTCRGATKPMRHNYWACALEPASHNYWACVPQLLKPTHLDPVLHNKRSHHNEKPVHRKEE